MQKFAPVSEIKTKTPTVTMLSHVWFAKDIKTALLAADIISNEWGFKDYKLDIYGALNKAPVYSSECQEILACKGLGQSVTLRGTADPAMVLANTWLFLNSSVSEGLPLALGEAALTGAPVVCTDVGASLRVLTDPDDGKRYSEVVAPNDAYGLARAQINLLAMLDEWAHYAEDPPDKPAPILPHKPTPQDVEIITKRMYEKTAQRRKLGMMARSIVQKSFGGERYLREHEQMLWVGKARFEMLGVERRQPPPRHPGRMLSLRRRKAEAAEQGRSHQQSESVGEVGRYDEQLEKMQHPRPGMARGKSTTTSFSSMWMDEPGPSVRGGADLYDWGPGPGTQTPDSSIRRQDFLEGGGQYGQAGGGGGTYYFPPPLPHPHRAFRRTDTASSVGSSFTGHSSSHISVAQVAMGKKPVAGSRIPVPIAPPVSAPRIDPRRSVLMRQAVGRPESTRSSVRARSHLNEVQVAEYGNVDGRL